MSALRDNGFELLRALKISQEKLRDGDDPDLRITWRIAFSLRSNGSIMKKRDHRFADDQAGDWRIGKWKRAKKIPARDWRKLDRRAWLVRQREILIGAGYEITAEASEQELASMDHRCQNKLDQKRRSW
jgi:hypothetical protein